ncbi:MAG: oligosaccharide flippase family protein [Candidatus Pacebacteria bacterium]|nr:oligosaccharide flippase family protein [Candidatus Paceibacterota bacterium]
MIKTLKEKTEKTINFLEKMLRTDIRYLIKGYFWLISEYAFSLLAGLATSVAFANLIPPEAYGTFQYVLTIVSFLSLTTLTRLNDSLTISVAKGFEGGIIKILKTKIKWGLLGTFAGIILSAYYFYQNDSTLALLVLIAALFVPVLDTPYVYSNYLIGKKNFKVLSLINNAASIIYSVCIVITLFLSKDVVFIIGFYFLINFLIRLFALIFVLKKYKPKKETESQTIDYGKKISYLNIFNTVASSIDNIFVFHYLGAAELAAYAIAKKMPEKLKDLITFLTPLSAPKFAAKDISDPYIKNESLRKSLFLTLAMLAVILIYAIFAPLIFSLLFPVYAKYVSLSIIYALSIPVAAFGALLLNFMESKRRIKPLAKFNIGFALLKTMIMLFAIKYFGLTGLIWSFALTRALSSAMITYFFVKET